MRAEPGQVCPIQIGAAIAAPSALAIDKMRLDESPLKAAASDRPPDGLRRAAAETALGSYQGPVRQPGKVGAVVFVRHGVLAGARWGHRGCPKR